jgi:hypothetical protein
MKALDLDKLDAYMEIEYDGEIYDAHTENDINDKAINAIPIPDNATNGDIIKAVFPNASTWIEYDSNGDVMRFDVVENTTLECFNLDWWNAPYKGGKK